MSSETSCCLNEVRLCLDFSTCLAWIYYLRKFYLTCHLFITDTLQGSNMMQLWSDRHSGTCSASACSLTSPLHKCRQPSLTFFPLLDKVLTALGMPGEHLSSRKAGSTLTDIKCNSSLEFRKPFTADVFLHINFSCLLLEANGILLQDIFICCLGF